MNKFLKSFAVAAAITMSASAVQAANIAQFQQTDAGVASFALVNAGPTYTVGTNGAQSVTANILGDDYMNSTLNFTASGSTDAVVFLGTAAQALDGGTFSLVNGMTNLLSFTFTEGVLSGALNGNTGGLLTLATSGFTSVSSDVIDFTTLALTGFSISLSSINPVLSLADNRIADFAASATGTISADVTGGPGGIPEPGTWAMMIAGFGLVGLSRRRQRSATVVAA